MVTIHDPGSFITNLSSQVRVDVIKELGAKKDTLPLKGNFTSSNPVNEALVFSDPELPCIKRLLMFKDSLPFLENLYLT